ncbi:nuclear transport factor 2 family protein [Actinomycetes bacterium KLBMP 9759]
MHSRLLRAAGTAAAALIVLAGCGDATTAPLRAAPPSAQAVGELSGAHRAALQAAERLVTALNHGDEAGVRAAFAPDARFDSVGRIYPDREAIMDRFLIPEVLRIGGTYRTLATAPGVGDRVVVEYEFTTSSGGRERFTYDYLVIGTTIKDVVGRYEIGS